MVVAYEMSKLEIESIKERIRGMLRYKKAGQCYELLTELVEEGKAGAIQYHIDKEEAEREKYIPHDPKYF